MDQDADKVPADYLAVVHDAITAATDAPDAVLAGFAVVAEWIESDGRMTTSILHTPMPSWHLYGLLTYGREWSSAARSINQVE